MSQVEQSIREVVRDWVWGYQQALVDYWNQPVDGFRSRQHWLSAFFGELMICFANTAEGLSDEQVDVLRQVFKYPLYTDRIRLLGRTPPKVYFVQVQANAALKRIEYLVPDIVVVYPIEEREQVLVCKPSGHIESFASLSAYGRYLGRSVSPLDQVDNCTRLNKSTWRTSGPKSSACRCCVNRPGLALPWLKRVPTQRCLP